MLVHFLLAFLLHGQAGKVELLTANYFKKRLYMKKKIISNTESHMIIVPYYMDNSAINILQ